LQLCNKDGGLAPRGGRRAIPFEIKHGLNIK